MIAVLALGLSACQMTQEVAQEMRSTTIGGQGIGSSQTQSRTTHPAPGTTVTRSTTTSASIGLPALTEDIVVCPAEWIHLVCEAQISVDARGLSSRCASAATWKAAASPSRAAPRCSGPEPARILAGALRQFKAVSPLH